MQFPKIDLLAEGAAPVVRPFFRLLPIILLLPSLSGCVRPVTAMPAFLETPIPAPAAAAIQETTDDDAPPDSGLSLDTVRSLFLRSDADHEPTLSRLLYSTALHSPLATQPLAVAEAARAVLPTPTRTPGRAQDSSVAATEPLTATIPITELLQLPLPDVGPARESSAAGPGAVALPTPTPRPAIKPVTVQPTPDGVVRSARVPILMYHYLSVPPPDADVYRRDLSVSPDLFAAHLDAMRDAGYTTITLYDLVAHLTQSAPLPERPVIITFDDGYRDAYENAFPLLRERDMVATFFVVTDFMDEERPQYLDWDMAREMLEAGMKIESHGRNHVSLRDKDHDYLVWQALGSLETIEYELGVRPRFVSYPAGEYSQATADLFASAGYWAGVTTGQGATHSSDSLFDLNRVRVRGTTAPEELLRLLALDW